MNSKSILTGLLISIFLVGIAFADSAFYGPIDYRDCDCTGFAYADRVVIYNMATQDTSYQGVTCRAGGDGYTTVLEFPAGWYKLWVKVCEDSECDRSLIEQVYHDGIEYQEVKLIVLGKAGQPDGGGE